MLTPRAIETMLTPRSPRQFPLSLSRSPHRNNDNSPTPSRSSHIQSDCREFHELLDEKLRDIRNWVVEEHNQRLEMLQTRNRTLESLLVSQDNLLFTSPCYGPRAQISGSLAEIGHDLGCDEVAFDEFAHTPKKLSDAGEKGSQGVVASASEAMMTKDSTEKTAHRLSEAIMSKGSTEKTVHRLSEAVMSKGSTEKTLYRVSPTDHWHFFVGKLLSPASRLSRHVKVQKWDLKSTWLDAKKRISLTEHDTKFVLTAFETVEELQEGARAGRNSGLGNVRHSFSGDPLKSLNHDVRCLPRCVAASMWFLTQILQMWNLLRLIFVLYDTIMVPVLVFLTEDLVFAKAMSWISRIFWTVDLGLRLMMNYGSIADKMTPCRPTLRYLKGWFGFDLCIILSDWLLLLSGTRENSPGNFLRMARVAYTRKWLYIQYRRKAHQQYGVDHVENTSRIKMLEAIFAFAIVIHVWACAWYGVGNLTEDGWTQEPLLETSWDKYLISFAWAARQIHGASDGEVLMMNTSELVFSAVSVFIGFILFLFFVGRAVNAEAVRFRNRQNAERKICVNFCNVNHLSPDLCSRAIMHFRNKDKKRKLVKHLENEGDFLSLVPRSLRMDMKEQILGRFFTKIDFFRALDASGSSLIRKVCDTAVSMVPSFDDEIIFSEGDVCNNVYIVQTGSFCYQMGRNWTLKQTRPLQMFASFTDFLDPEKATYHAESFDCRKLGEGRPVSEAVLWTKWMHAGNLYAHSLATLIALQTDEVSQIVLERKDTTSLACHYAARFVSQLNAAVIKSDLFCYRVSADDQWREGSAYGDSERHFAFLSHFKAEAGTEATLIHQELTRVLAGHALHAANKLESPVFLDSSDLNDLKQLRAHVEKSQNLILMLTPGVLSRPWCVLEICVAVLNDNRIIPVEVQRPGLPAFAYPQEEFYQKLRRGALLSNEGMDLLLDEGFAVSEVEAAIRRVFMHIALPFSPHKSSAVRQAELSDIFARCIFNEAH